MDNYFNYFTEIEEHFQRRRVSILLLSTLDWALIETWKDAGIPLEAVLRGIDSAFDKYDRRPSKTRKVNSLAYCAQEVMAAAAEMKEAAVGTERKPVDSGFKGDEVAAYLSKNADALKRTKLPGAAAELAAEGEVTLRALAIEVAAQESPALEDLERRLAVMEEKLQAALLAATADDELVAVRADADRELAPYRSKMSAAQIQQLHRQYVNKRLLERYHVPRLSLFYM